MPGLWKKVQMIVLLPRAHSLSLRSEGPHVLSVTTLRVLVLWEGDEAGTAMLDFMGIWLVLLYVLPWYTGDRMRLYQTNGANCSSAGPSRRKEWSRARSVRHALHVYKLGAAIKSARLKSR